jgi:Ni,Fe-hydrogenase I small subunit
VNFNISRRQFLQYCAASAAALGLSQTDLLKLERALAVPSTGCGSPTPSVVWMSGQNCTGCQTSLLNRVVDCAGTGYYDGDLLEALTSAAPGTLQGTPSDPVPELNVVNDVADLLVGDAVGFVVPQVSRALGWAPFPDGHVTLEWLTTVQAGAGDINTEHLKNVVEGGGFFLLLDGAIPGATDVLPGGSPFEQLRYSERYSLAFDNETYSGTKVIDWIDLGVPVTLADALRWMLNSGNCLAVLCVGSCSCYGGIPGAAGNTTGAKGYWTVSSNKAGTIPHQTKSWLYMNQTMMYGVDINRYITAALPPVVNIPGCPPHPDWIIYPVAHFLIHAALPEIDAYSKRPKVLFENNGPFCYANCANRTTKGTTPVPGDPDTAAMFLGDSGCTQALGCRGESVFGDCPIRQKNVFDDGTVNNWCVGSDKGPNIANARHVCQGCIEPGFPDRFSSFYKER